MTEVQQGTGEVGHTHADVSGGWLRAAVFGAMDGLVTNIALVAGIGAAGATARTVVLTGVAGLVAGAFSMALGEYTSVTTQNEQIDHEVDNERAEMASNAEAEEAELALMFEGMGLSEATSLMAAAEIHADPEKAIRVHLTQELGVDPQDRPSPYVAAGSSFVMFAIGAIVPLIPYLLGLNSLFAGLVVGAFGLVGAGALAARFTAQPWWRSALRQVVFGFVAAGATYVVGLLIGVSPTG